MRDRYDSGARLYARFWAPVLHRSAEALIDRVVALDAEPPRDLLDLGTFSTDPVDYPDYARAVGQAVLRGFVDLGVLICGSGAGAAIAANKIRGVRAALCHDAEAARLSREEDDANLLCLGAREVDPAAALEIASAWLAASFSGDERFIRKVSKIALLEGGLHGVRPRFHL